MRFLVTAVLQRYVKESCTLGVGMLHGLKHWYFVLLMTLFSITSHFTFLRCKIFFVGVGGWGYGHILNVIVKFLVLTLQRLVMCSVPFFPRC